MIQYNGNGLGGWSLWQGRLFATTPEGTDNRNGYTGICLLAPGSAGVDSIVAHSVYLQANHAYWVYGMIGEYGDSKRQHDFKHAIWWGHELLECRPVHHQYLLALWQAPAGSPSSPKRTATAPNYTPVWAGSLYPP